MACRRKGVISASVLGISGARIRVTRSLFIFHKWVLLIKIAQLYACKKWSKKPSVMPVGIPF
jgi:hypothetical protein